MKLRILVLFIIGSVSSLCAQTNSTNRCLKLIPFETKSETTIEYRVPEILINFIGDEWAFTSGDFTNVNAEVIFSEVKKVDELPHVINGFVFVVPEKYTVQEAASVLHLTPRGVYYLVEVNFQNSEKKMSYVEFLNSQDKTRTLEEIYSVLKKKASVDK